MFNNFATSPLFSRDGCVSRSQFWRTYFSLIIPEFIIGIVASLTASGLFAWLLWSLYTLLAIMIVFLVIKRLHDVQKSGWWMLLLSLPVVNIYILYLLFIKKGS